MEKFLWQNISGGIEYHYLAADGDMYYGFGYDHATALKNLKAKLGWNQRRLNAVKIVKF